MEALNFAHLDSSIIEQVVGAVGTVLGTERSKGIRVGFSLRRAPPPAAQVLFPRKWREEVGITELKLEVFLNLRGPHTFLSLIVSLSTSLG